MRTIGKIPCIFIPVGDTWDDCLVRSVRKTGVLSEIRADEAYQSAWIRAINTV